MSDNSTLKRSRRYDSRRFFREPAGEPMPAYVVGEYVIEKARRDWNHLVPGQSAATWAGPKEWWEVRRQGSATQPGVSIGKLLYAGATLHECVRWVSDNSVS